MCPKKGKKSFKLTKKGKKPPLKCDPSFGNLCDKVTCENCPYCQIEDKILCQNCDKCSDVTTPYLIELSQNELHFFFKEAIIIDKEKQLPFHSFDIKNNDFVIALASYLEDFDNQTTIMTQGQFSYKFKKHFDDFSLKFKENYYFGITSKEQFFVNVLEKKLEISEVDNSKETFEDFVSSSNEKLSNVNSGEMKEIIVEQINCPQPKAYVISIDPKNIKIGLNGVLKKNTNLIILSKPKCVSRSISTFQIAKEFSMTFLTLIVSNFIKDILFSFLNNKEILDVVKFHDFQKPEKFLQFEDFFNTFDCKRFPSFYDENTSFVSNKKIKGMFIKEYEKSINISIFKGDDNNWLNEYNKQFEKNTPLSIKDGYNCRFHVIFPEYVFLGILGLFYLTSFSFIAAYLYHRWKTIKRGKFFFKLKTVVDFIYKTLINSLLFIYYSNLASFCFLIKLVRTPKLGIIEFLILIFRGGMVIYPFFYFMDLIINTKKQIKMNKKIKTYKGQTKNVNSFFKEFKSKKVHAKWIVKMRKIIVLMRISFKNAYKTFLNINPIKKKKSILKKWIIKINSSQKNELTRLRKGMKLICLIKSSYS